MEQTIEQKVAAVILEKPLCEIEIGGITFKLAPPTLATLIMVSEIVSTLPLVERGKYSKDMIIPVSLNVAKEYRALGDIIAILLLGANNLTEERTRTEVVERRRFWGLFKTRKERVITEVVDKKAELSKLIIENVSPSVIWEMILQRLTDMQVGDFFGITTSLTDANILQPTRGVVN